ncbi:unnamed protein product, partial [Prorocentrum cordatum]
DDCLFDVSYKMLVEGEEGHRRSSRSRTAPREARAVPAAQDEESDKAVGSRMPRLRSAPQLHALAAVPAAMRRLHPRAQAMHLQADPGQTSGACLGGLQFRADPP